MFNLLATYKRALAQLEYKTKAVFLFCQELHFEKKNFGYALTTRLYAEFMDTSFLLLISFIIKIRLAFYVSELNRTRHFNSINKSNCYI